MSKPTDTSADQTTPDQPTEERGSELGGAPGSPPMPDAFGIFLNGNLQMVELAQPGHKTPAIYMTFAAAQHHCRDDEDIVPIRIARAGGTEAETIDRMVDRFLCWPLPESVCPDECVMDRKYPHRIGTNLLTAVEAKQMFEHVLANAEISARGEKENKT